MSRQRSAGVRPRLARATTSAIRSSGSFTPLDDATHVTPTARVFGVMARPMRSTICAPFAEAAESYSGM